MIHIIFIEMTASTSDMALHSVIQAFPSICVYREETNAETNQYHLDSEKGKAANNEVKVLRQVYLFVSFHFRREQTRGMLGKNGRQGAI